jgi:quercetin dioxygenase-like cupin family protein
MTKTLPATLAAFCAMILPALAQAPVIDNERVTARDVALQQGVQAPAISHAGDYVVLYQEGGRIRDAEGKTVTHPSGFAVFGHGGITSDTPTNGPAHEVVVELKDAPSKTVPNTSGLPLAFPRPGSVKILENEKVRVWNYAWKPGKPTAMHFHNTEVVVVYRGDGDIASTTQDGKVVTTHHNPGDIVFNAANRIHSEEVVKGQQSGIMLELK